VAAERQGLSGGRLLRITSTLNLGPLQRFPRQFHTLASQHVRRTAFAIERDAKMRAPVDTGALRASIYTVTHGTSGYSRGIRSVARRRGKSAQAPSIGSPASPLEAIVAVGVNYGIYVELGTHKMAAQPYLIPAAEAHRKAFQVGARRLLMQAWRQSI
jgi:hypothetical protein